MIRLALFFVVVFALAAGTAWFADTTGGMPIVFTLLGQDGNPARELRTNVGGLLLIALIVLALAVISVLVLRFLLRSPGLLQRFGRKRREESGYKALTKGLVAVAAGDAKQAKKHAKKTDALRTNPAMTLLLRAQTAQLEGDREAAVRLYDQMAEREETELLGLRGQFVEAQREGQYDKALELAQKARQISPKAAWVLNALFEMQIARGNWDEALKALDGAMKSGLVDAQIGRRRRSILLTQKALELEAQAEKEAALKAAMRAHDLSPALQPAGVLAARLLIDKGRNWRAAEVIETAWSAAPHPDLAELYAGIKAEEPPKALAKWLKGLADFNADHKESRLLMAAQFIRLEQWEDARAQLESLMEAPLTARVGELMATIEGRADNPDPQAGLKARAWIGKTARAPRDTVWICNSCAFEALSWSVLCPNCNAFDSLTWRAPVVEPITAILETPDGENVPLSGLPVPVVSEDADDKADTAMEAELLPVEGDRGEAQAAEGDEETVEALPADGAPESDKPSENPGASPRALGSDRASSAQNQSLTSQPDDPGPLPDPKQERLRPVDAATR